MSIDRTPLRHTHLASLVLGAAALLAASGAHAQSAAVLDCSAGQTTASVTIVTDTTWQQSIDGGTSWAAAATASNGGWGAAPTGSSWIGNGSSGPVTPLFRRVLQLGAGVDPVVPLTVSATFRTDDVLGSLTIGGLPTGISGGTYNAATATTASGSVTLPGAGTYPIIATVNNTGGGAYGLAANLTITATCRAAPPAAVPADAPWALGLLAGMIGVAAAGLGRRRRKG